LGHVILVEGVKPNQDKISVIQQWPIPQTVKELRGFVESIYFQLY